MTWKEVVTRHKAIWENKNIEDFELTTIGEQISVLGGYPTLSSNLSISQELESLFQCVLYDNWNSTVALKFKKYW